jgi:hypothetical protein
VLRIMHFTLTSPVVKRKLCTMLFFITSLACGVCLSHFSDSTVENKPENVSELSWMREDQGMVKQDFGVLKAHSHVLLR